MTPRSTLVLLSLATLLATATSLAVAETERRDPPQASPTPRITADQLLARAAFLASDELAGRESGTEEGRRTEDHLAAELERIGLEPGGEEGGWFQTVPLPTRNPDPEASTLHVLSDDAAPAAVGEPNDVIPFAFSAAGGAEGQVAFAGFGLTDPENGYDDYVGLDCEGKVVLLLRHAPGETDPESPWSLRNRRGRRAMRALQLMSFTAKASRAARAGAAAVLIVNDRHHGDERLPVTLRGALADVPVLAVSRAVAERLFEGSGTSLFALEEQIDTERSPRSRLLDVRVAVQASVEEQVARNVVGVLRGADASLEAEAVLLGAHMDHVGMGWFGSPAGGGQIHNGADDNASGTAALLEVAEWLASQPAPRRSVVVAFWCGEEKGLIGSRHYAEKPLWPLEQTIACLNMDMVGRYRAEQDTDEGLRVGGAPTGSSFTGIVDRLAAEAGARLTHSWANWPQSDHYSFYAKGVPSLFLTTGIHPEYHRPGDDWWLLNAEGAALVAGIAARTALALANDAERPVFAERPPRPILGVRLADDPDREGALLATVFPNRGAAESGLESGDLVTAWNGAPVQNAEALGRLIGGSAVGDVVTLTIVRGDEELTVDVTLSGA